MAQSTIHVHCYRYGSIVIHSGCGVGYQEVDTMERVVLQNSRDSSNEPRQSNQTVT